MDFHWEKAYNVSKIKWNERGFFYPQNAEYVKTSEMVKIIANTYGKKICMAKLFNSFISLLKRVGIVNKVFGDFYYEKSMSEYKEPYCKVDFEESIRRTELK